MAAIEPPPGFPVPEQAAHPSSWEEATRVAPVPGKEGVYTADIKLDWRVGDVPNGGYIAGLLLTAVRTYFSAHHPALNQPDPITAHFEFLVRTQSGPCTMHIQPSKLGRQFSSVRVHLLQPPTPTSKEETTRVSATITHSNTALALKTGISLPTNPYFPTPPARASCIEFHESPTWQALRPVVSKLRFFLPPTANPRWHTPESGPSVRESWVTFNPTPGPGGQGQELFTPEALPLVMDDFVPLVEAYGLRGYWFPTLSLDVDIKRTPPLRTDGRTGWEWLFVRIEGREIVGGRMSVEAVVVDESGGVVAVGRQVMLVVEAGRALRPKGEVGGAKI